VGSSCRTKERSGVCSVLEGEHHTHRLGPDDAAENIADSPTDSGGLNADAVAGPATTAAAVVGGPTGALGPRGPIGGSPATE